MILDPEDLSIYEVDYDGRLVLLNGEPDLVGEEEEALEFSSSADANPI